MQTGCTLGTDEVSANYVQSGDMNTFILKESVSEKRYDKFEHRTEFIGHIFYFDACNKQNGFLKGKFKQDFFKLTLNIGVEEDENSKSVSLGGTLKVVGEQKHGISTRHLQGYLD